MSRWRLLKVIGCFVLTFVLGAVVGWVLKPVPPRNQAWTLPPSEHVLQNLDAKLKLTPAQKTQLRPLLEEWRGRLEPVARRPRRRLELFDEFSPRVRELLTSDQKEIYAGMVEEARKRIMQRMR